MRYVPWPLECGYLAKTLAASHDVLLPRLLWLMLYLWCALARSGNLMSFLEHIGNSLTSIQPWREFPPGHPRHGESLSAERTQFGIKVCQGVPGTVVGTFVGSSAQQPCCCVAAKGACTCTEELWALASTRKYRVSMRSSMECLRICSCMWGVTALLCVASSLLT